MAVSGVYRPSDALPESGGGGDAGPTPDVVVVGAASRDLTEDDDRGWRLGGGATYASLACARLGLRVGCLLGVDREAGSAPELALLRAAGVRLVTSDGSIPVLENIEGRERRRQRWFATADPLPSGLLPESWRDAPGWLLAPIASELDSEWGNVPPPDARVALGWQGLLREFGADGAVRAVPPVRDMLVAAAQLVVASVDDLPHDTDLADVRSLLSVGAVFVATAGDRGGIAFHPDGARRYRAIPAVTVDPTGAGDVFLAGLMAGWLSGDEPGGQRSLRLAAAVASCSVEGWGLAGVPSRVAVETRLRAAPRG